MAKIIKSFGKVPEFEIDKGGTFTWVSYGGLKPYLEQIINLKPNEEIERLVIDENGINIKIETKNG